MIRNELPYSKEEYYVGAQGNPELNIDITENGDYDVRKYATAKVNVSGGGDIWQIAFNPTQYKIEGFQGEYELQDGGHGEYGLMINLNVAPEEVLSDPFFTEEFTVNINGNDYVMKPYYLNAFQSQDAGDYTIVVSIGPSPEDENEAVFVFGINTVSELPVTVTINCPDITLATATDDAISLATLLSPLL